MCFSYIKIYYVIFFLFCCPFFLHAQASRDSLPPVVSLQECIRYALKNQPVLKQATLDEEINERNISIALSAWLPQVGATGSYQHYFQLPSQTVINGAGAPIITQVGVNNTSAIGFSGNQTIYNNDVLLASRTARFSRQYYKQNTLSSQINVVSDVSKAFYSLLLSEKQLEIINANIVRLRRALKDAYQQYQAGVVDKIDYKQATIALNNELASHKQTQETVKANTATLKELMGNADNRPINPVYDSIALSREIAIDTNVVANAGNRIEYQLLETTKSLQNLNVSYYRYGYLPSVSAFGNYNLSYLSNQFSTLYNQSYPNAYAGLTLTIPIFQGNRRLQNLRRAKLVVDRADLDLVNSRNVISTEVTQALASYKSNYVELTTQKENVDLANEVYNVVFLQYREGIKTYLDVIVAQSDLRTSQINYNNALFMVLSSKVDLQRALGSLPVNY
ncbi:TolC family protein [Mucilaginibacter arboris]|uniref:TolC family protein n=1 Tax=Mucilaginibacter arboris TaxID=2682090 RepID=A0A7K1T0M0_9SPHI|nr:TolC family protein [Mucilaginibacter arboris]MVN23109.1 TolC family protein [Mucilaginibacter arboris]